MFSWTLKAYGKLLDGKPFVAPAPRLAIQPDVELDRRVVAAARIFACRSQACKKHGAPRNAVFRVPARSFWLNCSVRVYRSLDGSLRILVQRRAK